MLLIPVSAFMILISQCLCASTGDVHNGVREGPPRTNSNNGVRPAPVSEGISATSSTDSSVESPREDAQSTSGDVQPASPAESGTKGTGDFASIRDEFVGGMTAIRDSTGKLIGFTANTIKEGVVAVFKPIIDVKDRVVNKTVQIGSSLSQAGHGIAETWGHSLSDTKNITGQLIHNVGR